MKRYINLLAFAAICIIAGCRDEGARHRAEVMKNADAALNEIAEKGPQADSEKYLQEADRLIDIIQDGAEKREVVEIWMDRLLSVDLSLLNFDRWYRSDIYIIDYAKTL